MGWAWALTGTVFFVWLPGEQKPQSAWGRARGAAEAALGVLTPVKGQSTGGGARGARGQATTQTRRPPGSSSTSLSTPRRLCCRALSGLSADRELPPETLGVSAGYPEEGRRVS